MTGKTFRFEEIAESITERVDDPTAAGVDRYVGLEHLDPETTHISRWGSPGDVQATKLRFYPGDVIYGRRRAYQRKLGVAQFDGICSAHALVLRARPETCLPGFLPYFLHSDRFHTRALEISVGSLSPTINWTTLRSQEFELPSLDEQARLVELVSAIEECVESTRRMRDVVRVLRQLLLSGEVRAQGTQYPLVQLRDLVEVLDHMRRPISSDERAGRVGAIPYYGATGRTGWIDDHLFDEDLVLLGEDAVDFMNPTCEKAYFVSGKSWVNNHAHVLRPVIHVVDAKYLVAALNQVDYTKFASFGTRSKLTKSAMMEIELAVPDLQVQKSIVAKLDGFDTALKSLDESVACARNLQLSILNSELS